MLFRKCKRASEQECWLQLMVPKELRQKLLIAHETWLPAHKGIKETYRRLCLNYYWPHMYRDVWRCVSHCIECRRGIDKPEVYEAPLGQESRGMGLCELKGDHRNQRFNWRRCEDSSRMNNDGETGKFRKINVRLSRSEKCKDWRKSNNFFGSSWRSKQEEGPRVDDCLGDRMYRWRKPGKYNRWKEDPRWHE